MNIYFDTEFTGLHKNTTLISIGCIAENDNFFYAEFEDYVKSQCDDWINENVIANLKMKVAEDYYTVIRGSNNPRGIDMLQDYSIEMNGTKEIIRKELIQWLSQFDEVQFVSDVCHYDFVLLIDLLGNTAFDLPKNCNPSCHDINQDIAEYYKISEKEAFDLSREDFLDNNTYEVEKHNALYDAKVIKEISEWVSYSGEKFVNLKKGDIIFTHKQTEQLVNKGKINE